VDVRRVADVDPSSGHGREVDPGQQSEISLTGSYLILTQSYARVFKPNVPSKKRTVITTRSTDSLETPKAAAIAEFCAILDVLGIRRPLLRGGHPLDGSNVDLYRHLSHIADIELCLDGKPVAILLSVERFGELVGRSGPITGELK